MTARISVLIVNFNATQMLRDCLDAVLASTCRADLQVIVVDNASVEFPLAELRTSYPAVEWLPQSTNTTFTGGTNLAFEKATGDLVLLLNPDTRVEPDAIELAANHLQSKPGVVGVGARLTGPDGELQRVYYRRLPTFRDIPTLLFESALRQTPRARQFLMLDQSFEGTMVVDHVAAAFHMVKRSALSGRLLDPGYFNLLSDLDLSRRLAESGSIVVCSDVRCFHWGGGAGSRPGDIASRMRLFHDFTWGLRRYFAGELSFGQRILTELMIGAYWAAQVLRVLLLAPRSSAAAARVAASALAGKRPRF